MPNVRLSGTVTGKTDPKRKERAELLYHLFSDGWDIYNGNGDQTTRLENIQRKIVESDAFVFTANPNLDDYFNLTSIFVGFQTLDQDLNGKPAIIINSDGSWDVFLSLFDHLHGLGTIKEDYRTCLKVVKSLEEAVDILNALPAAAEPEHKHVATPEPDIIEAGSVNLSGKNAKLPERNICVFCSASIRNEEYLNEGYNVGKMLAGKGWGCVSGAGKTGIMGQVVKGAYENGGWSGGSNVPHIIRLEGLPEGLSEFWPRADIYTRMQVMIEKSSAFVIMPGGMGTVQELLAMLLLKNHKDDMMRDKKIIIYNKYDKSAKKYFWEPMIEVIKSQSSLANEFVVVESVEDIFKQLEK